MLTILVIFGCAPNSAPGADSGPQVVDCSTEDMGAMPTGRGELDGTWDPVGRRFIFFGGNSFTEEAKLRGTAEKRGTHASSSNTHAKTRTLGWPRGPL